MKTDQKEIRFQLILAAILAVSSFSFFQFLYPSHLFLKEQLHLYLFTAGHFLSYLDEPAALACNAGDFLTQFFYLRGGGPLVLSLLFLLEWRLVTMVLKRLQAGVFASLLALFPVAAEWACHTDLLYEPSHTVAFILVLLAFLGYAALSNRWVAMGAGLVITFLLYPLAGAASLLFPWLVVAYDGINRKKHTGYGLLPAALTLVIPWLLRGTYLLTPAQAYLYPFLSFGQCSAMGVFVLCVLVACLFPFRQWGMSVGVFAGASVALLVLLAGGLLWKANFRNEKTYTLAVESYFGHWDKVVRLAEKDPDNRNRLVTYYTDIALSKQHSLADRLLDFYQPATQGLFIPVEPGSGWLPIFFSSDVFYHLGDMNMAQHSAMLGMTFSPHHRSSRLVRRLAEINLANADTSATRKYLRLLNATLFHRRWAAGMEQELSAGVTDSASWLLAKRKQLPTYDCLRTASDYAASLTLLVKSHPGNREALDYLLCYYLLAKDIPAFMTAYDTWFKGKYDFIPRLYSEALLIHLASVKAPEKVLQSYQIPNDKITAFMEYTRNYEANKGEMGTLREVYGRTYWFYYHFAQMVEQ